MSMKKEPPDITPTARHEARKDIMKTVRRIYRMSMKKSSTGKAVV